MKKRILSKILFTTVTSVSAVVGTAHLYRKRIDEQKQYGERYIAYYKLLFHWVETMQNGKSIGDYFYKNGYKKIAIYGAGSLGELLFNELKKQDGLNVVYFIDKESACFNEDAAEMKTIAIDQICQQEQADVIIVTPIYDYNQIVQNIENAGCETECLSLEEIFLTEH